MTKLLNCPFCGGSPVGPNKSNSSDERSGYNFYVSISCGICKIEMRSRSQEDKGGWCNDTGQALEKVIKAWNTRSTKNE